jgi:hypothetical protein
MIGLSHVALLSNDGNRSASSVMPSILHWTPATRSLPAMPLLSCCYLPALVLAGHASKHAATSDWVTVAPNWITALGTAIVAVIAIFAVIYAVRAFRAQAGELAVLVDQHERDKTEHRKAQAARVYVGIDRDPSRTMRPYVKNGSDFPIFDVQSWDSRPGNPTRLEDLGVILPSEAPFAGPPRNRNDALSRTVVTFRDANNVRWVRLPNGDLKPQTRESARESVLEALGQPLTVPSPGGRRAIQASEASPESGTR